MQNTKQEMNQATTQITLQELSTVELEQIAGGFADAWWASNRPMAAKIGISRWDLMSAM